MDSKKSSMPSMASSRKLTIDSIPFPADVKMYARPLSRHSLPTMLPTVLMTPPTILPSMLVTRPMMSANGSMMSARVSNTELTISSVNENPSSTGVTTPLRLAAILVKLCPNLVADAPAVLRLVCICCILWVCRLRSSSNAAVVIPRVTASRSSCFLASAAACRACNTCETKPASCGLARDIIDSCCSLMPSKLVESPRTACSWVMLPSRTLRAAFCNALPNPGTKLTNGLNCSSMRPKLPPACPTRSIMLAMVAPWSPNSAANLEVMSESLRRPSSGSMRDHRLINGCRSMSAVCLRSSSLFLPVAMARSLKFCNRFTPRRAICCWLRPCISPLLRIISSVSKKD